MVASLAADEVGEAIRNNKWEFIMKTENGFNQKNMSVRLIALLTAILMILLVFASCNDRKVKEANSPGDTTDKAVQNLEDIADKLLKSTSNFEEKIPEIFFETIKRLDGTEYYQKWYKFESVDYATGVDDIKHSYDGNTKTLTFYYYFTDSDIINKMEGNANKGIPVGALAYVKNYINSLNLGINVDFKKDNNKKSGYSNICNESASSTHYDSHTYAYCTDNSRYGIIDRKAAAALIETDIVLQNVTSGKSVQRFQLILLHELGHAFGLNHPNASAIGKGSDYFRDESVMYEYAADMNIPSKPTDKDQNALYFTIDAAALRMLYGGGS